MHQLVAWRSLCSLVLAPVMHHHLGKRDVVEHSDMPNLGQTDFQQRVKRIKSPRNNSYYDPELDMQVPKHTTNEDIRRNAKARKFSWMRLVSSLLIGVLSVVIAQSFRVNYLGLGEPGLATLLIDLVLAWLVLLFLTALIKHRRFSLRLGQTVGVLAMFVAGHNLMWYFPNEVAIVYSTEYVDTVRARTEPMTLAVLDTVIGL